MNLNKTMDVVSRMNDILNMKYEEDSKFSDQIKDWAFFVSLPILIELKESAGYYLNVAIVMSIHEMCNLEVLGCKVFGVENLDNNIIYFAEIHKIKEDK